MSTQQCEERLKEKGIRPTAARILVLRKLSELMRPASLSELEIELETLDRSTIFRSHSETCAIGERHIHFFCEVCHQTTCLTDIKIPVASLPEGYTVDSINYTVKGVCPACNQKRL